MDQELTEQLKRFYTLWRETDAIYEDWAKRHGISYYELLIFFSLWENGEGCTQKEICGQWMLPKQTVNSILQNLWKREMVNFAVMEKDRRNKKVTLTDSGKRFADDLICKLQQLEKRVLQKMGLAQREALLQSTDLFNRLFREEGEAVEQINSAAISMSGKSISGKECGNGGNHGNP